MNPDHASTPERQNALPGEIEGRLQIVVEEFLAALQAGERPERAQVVAQHPNLAPWLDERLKLVELVFQAAQEGDAAGNGRLPADQAKRLKCPHCGNQVQWVEPRPKELTCLNCGSSFRLEPDSTVTFRSSRPEGEFGRFQVVELLGRGAFGEVYKAHDRELDRFVALKVPRADYFANAEESQRFLREARAAAGLRHSSIVQVHEIAHERGLPYIVSDYIEGLTLADLISGGRPGFRESAELLAQLADAVDYAHRQKVIHRDIKPSNILLTAPEGKHTGGPQFIPFLSDFGLARRDEGEITVTLDGQVLGTPAYMSPEQAAGDHARVDGRSDVYSLGVVLYELLSGELPFRGSRRMLLHQVLHDEPRPPRTLNDRIPRDLETICLKALAKEPARRYATAADFRDDLRRFLSGDAITARRVGRTERAWRWCRRNPIIAALSSTAILLLVAVATVSTVAYLRESQLVGEKDGLIEEKEGLIQEKDRERALAEAESRRADAKTDEARMHLYVARMNLARRNWEEGNGGVAIDILNRCAPSAGESDLRGWEWNYQQRLCHQELRVVAAQGMGDAVSFSPDGNRLATAGWGGQVSIWDVATGVELRKLEGHQEPVRHVAYSPDGKRLVTASDDFTIRIWDSSSGELLANILEKDDTTRTLGFDGDGNRLAAVLGSGIIRFHDAVDWQRSESLRMSFNATTKCLVPYTADESSHVNSATDKAVNSATDKAFFPRVPHAAFSSDLKRLAVVWFKGLTWREFPDRTQVLVWDLEDPGSPPTMLQTNLGEISDLTISPDGRWAAVYGTGAAIQVWDLSLKEPVRHDLDGSVVEGSVLRFNPDGTRLICGDGRGCLRIWEVPEGKLIRKCTGPSAVESLAFSPDGSRIASGCSDGVRLWDSSQVPLHPNRSMEVRQIPLGPVVYTSTTGTSTISTLTTGSSFPLTRPREAAAGQDVMVLEGKTGFQHVGVSKVGKWVTALDTAYEFSVWEVSTGLRLEGVPLQRFEGTEWSHAIRQQDGICIAAGTADRRKAVAVWDSSSGQPVRLRPMAGGVIDVALSRDGRNVAAIAGDGTIAIWDSVSGQELFVIGKPAEASILGVGFAPVAKLEFSPDAKFLAASIAEQVYVWNIPDRRQANLLRDSRRESCNCLAISDDNRLLAIGNGELVKPWNLVTGDELPELRGHAGLVHSLAFSPDGKRLTSGGHDRTIRVWDPISGQELQTLRGHSGPVDALAFSPDGYLLISASGDCTIRVHDAQPRTPEFDRFTEGRGIAEWVVAAAQSRADLVSRIEAYPGITEGVRQKVRELAPRYWRAELSVRADDIVKKLYTMPLVKADVIEALRQNSHLSEDVRSEAVRLVEERVQDDNNRLNGASWAIVVRADATADEYERALHWAEAACKLQPDDRNALNTLGVAQYRVGQLNEALATLTRSLKLNSKEGVPQPTDLAFLTMTHHALGNVEDAKALLDQLRELAKQPEWNEDAETQGFLREAEQLIEHPSPPAINRGADADGR